MLKITQYHKQHQTTINALVEDISKEFDEPISSNNPSIKSKTFDEYWIAEKDNLVIGTIGIIRLQNKNAILKSMFVKREYRGKEHGVSSLLLQTAIIWSKKEKIENIFLGTMTQFEAAQKFYEKNGFHRIDRTQLPLDFVHNPIDDIFYKIEIVVDRLNYRIGNKNDLSQIMKNDKRIDTAAW